MKVRPALPIALLVLAAGTASAAAGLGAVLKGSPFEFFNEDDTKQFTTTAWSLVETGKVGDSARWANEASGAWGTVDLKRAYKRSNGTPCRELRGENTARGRTEPYHLVLCRTNKGEWKIASSGPAKKK
jgi:surface antigen